MRSISKEKIPQGLRPRRGPTTLSGHSNTDKAFLPLTLGPVGLRGVGRLINPEAPVAVRLTRSVEGADVPSTDVDTSIPD